MPDETPPSKLRLPGLDPQATPLIGMGLGLAGVLLKIWPRMAAWPLALTAATALFYRDPDRITPDNPDSIVAPSDGKVTGIAELYEHRFLHTDAIRLSINTSLFDVPVQRSPVTGTIAYLEYVSHQRPGGGTIKHTRASVCQYIGINASWGPILLIISTGTLARQINCRVAVGNHVIAGERLCVVRLGAQVELLLPRDTIERLPPTGEPVRAGVTRIGQVVPL